MTKLTACTSMDCVSLSPKGLCDSCEKDFIPSYVCIHITRPPPPPVVDEENETREVE